MRNFLVMKIENICIYSIPPHEQDVTQGQFLRGICIYPTPLPQAECDTRSIFKRSLIGLNSEFSLTSYHAKRKEHSLPYYLPLARVRITGFIPFSRVLVLSKMQTASSRF